MSVHSLQTISCLATACSVQPLMSEGLTFEWKSPFTDKGVTTQAELKTMVLRSVGHGSFCAVKDMINASYPQVCKSYTSGDGCVSFHYLRELYTLMILHAYASASLIDRVTPTITLACGNTTMAKMCIEKGLCVASDQAIAMMTRAFCAEFPRSTILHELAQSSWYALSTFHGVGILHRDIKPSNMVLRLGKDGKPVRPLSVQLIDMNSSRVFLDLAQMDDVDGGDGGHGTSELATATTRPPEICMRHLRARWDCVDPELDRLVDDMKARGVNAQYGKPADVWAMGTSLLWLCSAVIHEANCRTDTRASNEEQSSPTRSDMLHRAPYYRMFNDEYTRMVTLISGNRSLRKPLSLANESNAAMQFISAITAQSVSHWFRTHVSSNMERRFRSAVLRNLDRATVLDPAKRFSAFSLACDSFVARLSGIPSPPSPGSLLVRSFPIRLFMFRHSLAERAVEGTTEEMRLAYAESLDTRMNVFFPHDGKTGRWDVSVVANTMLLMYITKRKRRNSQASVRALDCAACQFIATLLCSSDEPDDDLMLLYSQRAATENDGASAKKEQSDTLLRILHETKDALPVATYLPMRWTERIRHMASFAPIPTLNRELATIFIALSVSPELFDTFIEAAARCVEEAYSDTTSRGWSKVLKKIRASQNCVKNDIAPMVQRIREIATATREVQTSHWVRVPDDTPPPRKRTRVGSGSVGSDSQPGAHE